MCECVGAKQRLLARVIFCINIVFVFVFTFAFVFAFVFVFVFESSVLTSTSRSHLLELNCGEYVIAFFPSSNHIFSDKVISFGGGVGGGQPSSRL